MKRTEIGPRLRFAHSFVEQIPALVDRRGPLLFRLIVWCAHDSRFGNQYVAPSGLGWYARSDIGMSELGGATADNGGVDVLAWCRSTGTVLLIECKRLMMDKTAGELAERLQEYDPDHIDEKGNPGPLRKHLTRTGIIAAHPHQLSALTGIPADQIRIVNCLVTAEKVPMQFHDAWRGRVDIVSDLETFVGLPGPRLSGPRRSVSPAGGS
jgi:hypothetical protein